MQTRNREIKGPSKKKKKKPLACRQDVTILRNVHVYIDILTTLDGITIYTYNII